MSLEIHMRKFSPEWGIRHRTIIGTPRTRTVYPDSSRLVAGVIGLTGWLREPCGDAGSVICVTAIAAMP